MWLVWWYTDGLYALLLRLRDRLRELVRALNLKILVRYLFVPMYGYYDIWSRIISFWVRLVNFAILFIVTLVYLAYEIIVLVIWCALPVVVLVNIVYQLAGWL